MTLRVNVWSGPRNVSTALMYAFRQRADTSVVDEPFYAHYLTHTGLPHPGRDEVLGSQPTDADVVLDALLSDPGTDVLVAKQMAHHLRGLSPTVRASLDTDFTQVLLIRDPRLVLRSYARQVAHPTLDDLGYRELVDLCTRASAGGRSPVVVDGTELRRRPREVLTALCAAVGVAFDEAMLTWPAGPKPEDGVWAPHWYGAVHRSTGFVPPPDPPTDPLPDHLDAVAREAAPLHAHLAAHTLPI